MLVSYEKLLRDHLVKDLHPQHRYETTIQYLYEKFTQGTLNSSSHMGQSLGCNCLRKFFSHVAQMHILFMNVLCFRTKGKFYCGNIL